MTSIVLLTARISSFEPILDRIKKIFHPLLNIKISDFVFLVLISLILVLLIYLLVSHVRWKQRVRSKVKAIEKSLGIRESKVRPEKKVKEVKVRKEKEGVKDDKAKEEILEIKRVEERESVEEAEIWKAPELIHPEEVVETVEEVESMEPVQTREEVQAIQKEEGPPAVEEKPGLLTEEQQFLLSSIADEPASTYQEEALFKVYKMSFEKKDRPDFNTDIRRLKNHGFIQSDELSGYKVWLKITDKGLEYIIKQRKK